MGNLMIGDFYPPYLGTVDKIYCGDELCWPTNLVGCDKQNFIIKDNATAQNYIKTLSIPVASFNTDSAQYLIYHDGKVIAEAQTAYPITISPTRTESFVYFYQRDGAYSDYRTKVATKIIITESGRSYFEDCADIDLYVNVEKQTKKFILMDNPVERNIMDEYEVYAPDLESGSIELFNLTGEYGGSLVKIDSDGTVWEKSRTTYKKKEVDPLKRIGGEAYFTNGNDVIIYKQPFGPGTQKVNINIYQDLRNESNYTLAYTATETLDNMISPGTTQKKSWYNIAYNEDSVKITINQTEGVLFSMSTDSPAMDDLIEGSFTLNYRNFTNDDSIVYEMNYYVGPGKGSWTIILRDSVDNRTLKSIGMNPDEIWDNYYNNNLRNQSFQYNGNEYIRITYSEDIVASEPAITARITKYTAGYWVTDYIVSVINRNGLKIFNAKHVSYCYI